MLEESEFESLEEISENTSYTQNPGFRKRQVSALAKKALKGMRTMPSFSSRLKAAQRRSASLRNKK